MKQSLKAILLGLAMLLSVTAGTAQAQAPPSYADNFDSDAAGSQAPKFVNQGSAAYTVNTLFPASTPNAYGETTAVDGDITVMTGLSAGVGMAVQYSTVVHVNNTNQVESNIAPILESDSTGANGYLGNFNFTSSFQNFGIYKSTSGAFGQSTLTGGVGASIPAYTEGQKVWVKEDYNGAGVLKYKMWGYNTSEPASWLGQATDSAPITTAGYLGFRTGKQTGMASPEVDDLHFGPSGSVFTDPASPVPGPTYLATNTAIIHYSPYAWHPSSANAAEYETNCSNASFITSEAGSTSETLAFDTSGITANALLRIQVDALPFVNTTVASSVNVSLPNTAAHTVKVIFPFFAQTADRWNSPVNVSRLISVTPGSGGTLSAVTGLPAQAGKAASDSRGEGAVIGDATLAWPALVLQGLGFEPGVRSFASTGWSVVNASGLQAGNVVPFFTPGNDAQSAYNKYDSSHSLLVGGQYSPLPGMDIACFGLNDYYANTAGLSSAPSTANGTPAQVQASVTGWLTAERPAVGPACPIVILYDYSGFDRAAILAGFNAYQAATPDAKAYLVDIGTIVGLNGSGASYLSSEGLHPNQYGQTFLTAQIVKAIQAKLAAPTVYFSRQPSRGR